MPRIDRTSRLSRAVVLVLLASWVWAEGVAAETRVVDRLQHEARGIYALWGQESPAMAKIMALPFIHGSQIVMQWAEVEPQRGQYDFTALDHELEKLNREGLWTTLQINGNLKPEWLFAEVPYVKERLHVQVRDKQGTLMFWHPTFQAAPPKNAGSAGGALARQFVPGKIVGAQIEF